MTKDAVLNGKVVASSFAAEREAGTEPAAAFLKFKLLKSIASRPPDKPHLREAFIEGLGMLQASMAEAHTLQDMRDLMQEWDDAATGKERIEKISVAEAEAMVVGEIQTEKFVEFDAKAAYIELRKSDPTPISGREMAGLVRDGIFK